MRYDFRKIRAAIGVSGKTYRELQDETGIYYTTISRAVKTGRAHQSTARALVQYFNLSMKDIQVRRRSAA